MKSLSRIPLRGRLSPEEQKQFEKRARLDDPDDPPIVIDKNGDDIDVEDDNL